MFKCFQYAMVIVSDMNRSVQFYCDTLGFTLRFESPGWTEFQTGETTLALHVGAKPKPKTQGISSEKQAGSVLLGLSVPDLDHAVQELKRKGVQFIQEPTDQPEEGIKLATFVDPDGMPISLAQTTKW